MIAYTSICHMKYKDYKSEIIEEKDYETYYNKLNQLNIKIVLKDSVKILLDLRKN